MMNGRETHWIKFVAVRVLFFCLVVGLASGCAYKPPAGSNAAADQFTVDQPYAAAWRNTARALGELGFQSINDNFEAGQIIAEGGGFPIDPENYNCGSFGGRQFLKDYSNVIGEISLRVTVDSQGESASLVSVVVTNAKPISGRSMGMNIEFNRGSGSQFTEVRCISTGGGLQRKVIDTIKAKVEGGLSQ